MDKDVYLKEYRETIVDTFNQMMYMLDNNGTRNRKINLSIRDVGHRFVRDNMLADQDAFIVCYDVTNQETFFDVSQICKTITEMQLEEEIKKPIIVVGLKSDLAEQRSVDFQDGERTAEAYGAPYFECSAKQEINIEAVFDLLLTQIFK